MKWRKYYWRVIGVAMAGAGSGLVLDELINADSMHWNPQNHEFWGMIILVVGVYFISKKSKGKDLDA